MDESMIEESVDRVMCYLLDDIEAWIVSPYHEPTLMKLKGMPIPELPGLAITHHTGPTIHPDVDGMWSVTHIASGRKVGWYAPDPETALALAVEHLSGVDWTRDEFELVHDQAAAAADLAHWHATSILRRQP